MKGMCFLKKITLFLFLMLSLPCFGSTVANNPLYIVSFNVLAPCWANPDLYPAQAKDYLDRVQRRAHIIHFLQSVATQADIIALQETTATEFMYFKNALQNDFYGYQVNHAKGYWSNWGSPGIPSEPNGVAIFVKKGLFKDIHFRDLSLAKDGNHSAYFEGIENVSGKKVRAISVHLDSDYAVNRHHEMKALLAYLSSGKNTIDVIAGDFNIGTENGVISRYLAKNHFVDVLAYLKRAEWTHPFDVGGDRNEGILDHIVVRDAVPSEGKVINFDLWRLYPHAEADRITANFKLSGSDHFPIMGVVS